MEWRGNNGPTARPASTLRFHGDRPLWTIGYFLTDGPFSKNNTFNYSIVPTHWVLFEPNGLVCKWPNEKSINIANLVRSSTHLNEDYTLYHFKLVNNVYYDSLEEANVKLLEMFGLLDSQAYPQNSRSENRGEGSTISSPDRMEHYTIKKPTDMYNLESNYSLAGRFNHDDNRRTNIPVPKVVSNQNVGSLPNGSDDTIFSYHTQRMNQFGNDNMMNNIDFLPNSTSKVPLRTETFMRFEKEKSMRNNLHTESSQGETLQPSNIEWDTIKSELKDMKSELMANRIIRDQLWNRLDSLQKEITNLKSNSTIFTTHDPLDKLFLHLLPISSVEKLNQCEDMLKDTAIKDKLVNMFSAIGGDNEKSHVRRILNSLFTKAFAIRCSWTGRGSRKNISYIKIQGRLIIQIMQSVIIQLHNCSESEFEYIVQLWFTHARIQSQGQDQQDLST